MSGAGKDVRSNAIRVSLVGHIMGKKFSANILNIIAAMIYQKIEMCKYVLNSNEYAAGKGGELSRA